MSKRNKLQKFAEMSEFPNVYENFDPANDILLHQGGQEIRMAGLWATQHFGNNQPLVLELACGRGEYSLGLARMYPDKNFIGVDIKGARIWKGATTAIAENLPNVAFLRTRIELITNFFNNQEIAEIWITFPDPFLRNSKSNRRLTSPYFLNYYKQLLAPGGVIHLKTDSPELYAFTLETLQTYPDAQIEVQNDDIYAAGLPIPELHIKTYYEKMHLSAGKTIKYIRFTLP
jgi:tRNA (guanine-N7-)-methyltransferase